MVLRSLTEGEEGEHEKSDSREERKALYSATEAFSIACLIPALCAGDFAALLYKIQL